MAIEVRDSKIAGRGVFTTEAIPQHSVIMKEKYVREVTKDKPIDPEKGEKHEHCHWLPDGRQMLVSEPECYLNSSCSPNTFYYSVNQHFYLLAMRDIQKDEEITLCYELQIVNGEFWECKCGTPDCRGSHKLHFFLLPKKEQLKVLHYLDPWFARVHADKIEKLLEGEVDSDN